MDNNKHPIYAVAEQFWGNVELKPQNLDEYFAAIGDISVIGATESEALDALLAKLQGIICPDYETIAHNLQVLNADFIKDQAKISELEAQVESAEEMAFKAGQNSIGYRDEQMSRIDMTYETYKGRVK